MAATFQYNVPVKGFVGPALGASGPGQGTVDVGSGGTGGTNPGDGSGGTGSPGTGSGSGDGGNNTDPQAPGAAQLSFSPSALSFGGRALGEAAVASAVLHNIGAVAAQGLSLNTSSGVFTLASSDCGSTLAAGASCTVSVQFQSANPGQFSQSLYATSTSTASVDLALSASVAPSVPGAAILAFTPASLAFDKQLVGSSRTLTSVLSNSGASPAALGGVTVTGGGFTQSSDCGSSLGAGASCTVSVTYSPLSPSASTGSAHVSGDNGGLSLALTGTGQGVALSVDSASMDFGLIPVGAAPGSRTFTVTNHGNVASANLSASVSGAGFSASGCATSLAAGASCVVTVTFTPANTTPASATLTVSDGNGALASATMTGTGTAAHLDLSSTSLSFPDTLTSSTAPVQSVTIVNSGNSDALVSGVSVVTGIADYGQSNDCGTTLAAGASCVVKVAFTPSVDGTRSGILTVAALGLAPQSVSLSGRGIAPRFNTTVADVSFGALPAGSAAVSNTVTVTNSGTAPTAAPVSVAVTGGSEFALTTTNCSAVLAPGASCSASVQFSPPLRGYNTRTGSLVFAGGASLNTTVSLSGSSQAPVLTLSAASISLGSANIGAHSAIASISVNNGSAAPATVTGVTVVNGDSDFGQSNSCGDELPAGQSCVVSVQMTPTATGALSGTLAVTSASGTLLATLSGTGTAPAAGIDPTAGTGVADSGGALHYAIHFADTLQGNTASVRNVSFRNSGSGPLTVLGVVQTSGAADFNTHNDCPSVLAPGYACTISLTFKPSTAGDLTGVIRISSDSGTFYIDLSGTGIASVANPQLSTTTLAFGSVNVGSTASSLPVRLTNAGNAATVLGTPAVSVVGAQSAQYAMTTGCVSGATLAVGDFCDMTVSFQPTSAANASASLSVTTAQGTQVVTLSGTGDAMAVGGTLVAASANGTLTVTTANNIALSGATSVQLLSGATVVATSTSVAWAPKTLTVGFGVIPAAGNYTLRVVNGAGAALGTAGVTVQAQNILQLTDTSDVSLTTLPFGTVTAASTQTLRVANDSGSRGAVTVSSITPTGSSTPFSVTSVAAVSTKPGATCNLTGSTVSLSIPAGAACDVTVTLAYTVGSYNSGYALSIVSTADGVNPSELGTGNSSSLPVTGTVNLAPALSLSFENSGALGASSTGGSVSAVGLSQDTLHAVDGLASANFASGYVNVASSSAYAVGTGDFTAELWVYFTTAPSNVNVFDERTAEPSVKPNFGIDANGKPNYYVNGAERMKSPVALGGDSKWHHLALVRASGTVRIFIDGTNVVQTTDNSDFGTTAPLAFGAKAFGTAAGQSPISGLVDKLRFTKAALYTANFTPARGAFAVVASPTFPSTTVASTSAAVTVTFRNASNTASISGALSTSLVGSGSLSGTNASDFRVASTTCAAAIAPGGTCTANVTFTPSAVGTRSATLKLTSTDTGISATTVALSATGK